eukprot:TRINITY_DN856_c0_g1_i1.p1 TRINITY_DN856_c0_g1~~TRINITY_DN856_c0_g1_i1.p1  ORF type:complete len:261 (+),score=98.85 TRINITY_DN856_c0_g1_i1:103-885(+)
MQGLAFLLAVIVIFSAVADSNCQTAESLCDKYSRILNTTNSRLLGSLVTGFFGQWAGDSSPIKRWFDGTFPPGTENYVGNETLRNSLAGSIISFLALPNGLGCTDGTVGPYTGRTMRASHTGLMITNSAFSVFVTQAAGVLEGAGVAAADIGAIGGYLEGFRTTIVEENNATTAPTSAPTTAPTSAPTSAPTAAPTTAPTAAPTAAPTPAPTAAPTLAPTAAPTPAPTTPAPTPAPSCLTSSSGTVINLNFGGLFNGFTR